MIIPLTQGFVAFIDDEDVELTHFNWHATLCNGLWYASRSAPAPNSHSNIYLHREVVQAPPGVHVDHVNGNTLDCTRRNLRLATAQQNRRNRGKTRQNKSGFKGVYFHKVAKKWAATITVDGRHQHLGLFDSPEEAARRYDGAARLIFAEFAHLNFPSLRAV